VYVEKNNLEHMTYYLPVSIKFLKCTFAHHKTAFILARREKRGGMKERDGEWRDLS